MKASFILLLAVIAIAIAEDSPETKMEGVQELTNENFDEVVDGSKFALVEFYAPWCGHCKHLAPDYKKLGKAIADDPILSSKVVIAKVNADSDRKLGERFGISGFPTLKYFSRGQSEAKDYNSGRSFKDLLEFVKKQVENDNVGRLDDFDEIVKKFKDGEKEAAIKEAEEAIANVKEEETEFAKYYVSVMKRIVEKGADYAKNEKERIGRMLKTKSIKKEKVSTFVARQNILGAFTEEE